MSKKRKVPPVIYEGQLKAWADSLRLQGLAVTCDMIARKRTLWQDWFDTDFDAATYEERLEVVHHYRDAGVVECLCSCPPPRTLNIGDQYLLVVPDQSRSIGRQLHLSVAGFDADRIILQAPDGDLYFLEVYSGARAVQRLIHSP